MGEDWQKEGKDEDECYLQDLQFMENFKIQV